MGSKERRNGVADTVKPKLHDQERRVLFAKSATHRLIVAWLVLLAGLLALGMDIGYSQHTGFVTVGMAALLTLLGLLLFQHHHQLGGRDDVEQNPESQSWQSASPEVLLERQQADAQLRIAAAAFEAQNSMLVADAKGVVLQVNRAFTESTGYTAQDIVGKSPRMLHSGRHDDAFYRNMWRVIRRTGTWQGEIWDRRKNGEIYSKWLTISTVKGADGVPTHFIGTHQDTTENKKAEERIRELAFFDPLTHLPNRTLLIDRLRQAMTGSARSGMYGALLYIDLDHFKSINDASGHATGDLLLQAVAQRLTVCARAGDTVARLGGDEFVVVLPELSPNQSDAASATELVASKFLTSLKQPYLLGDSVHHSTASIGATVFTGLLPSVSELIRQADLAMCKSKDMGRNALSFFDPSMELMVKQRAELEIDLRCALESKQFVLHYQVQVVGDGRVTGAEALVRWLHPLRGVVMPVEFIGRAEETGLILPLGNWVLETACVQLALWAAQPLMAHLTLAVNVSALQFNRTDFVEQVLSIVKSSGANPQRLKLELTESLFIDRMDEVVEKMFALKAKGVSFSLDDFGTGYSSLAYLKQLPLDQLKIDRSFVYDALTSPNDAVIVKTIVGLGQSLGLAVIAEGVETREQRDFLVASGCHAFQGYYFSRPVALGVFEAYVQRASLVADPA
jgi:diguanylate cyclase (GGDEF)-like protein/PAS domain S-box-containing protein